MSDEKPSKSKALVKDVLVYSIGSFATRVLGFALLPIYTAILAKEEFGYIDLLLTGSMLFTTLASLRLFDGVYRFLWDAKDEQAKIVLVSSVLNATILNTLVLSAVLWIVLGALGIPFPNGWLVLLWTLIRLPAEYFQQTARVVGNKAIYSMSGIVMAVTLIAFNVVLLAHFRLGVAGYIWSLIASNVATLLYCLLANSGAHLYRVGVLSFTALKPLLAYTLPMIPAAVSWWIIRGSGRYFLGNEHGLQEVGLFSVSDKLPTVVYLLNMTFYMAWQDAVMRNQGDAEGPGFLSHALNTYIRLGLSALVVMAALLKPFFAVMVNGAYGEAIVYVPALLLSVFILCIAGLYDAFYLVKKQTGRLLLTSMVAAAAAVVANFFLVPQFSLWATVFSTFLSSIILLLIRMIDVHRSMRLRIDYAGIALLVAVFSVASFTYALQGASYIVVAAICIATVAILNRSDLFKLISKIRARFSNASIL